MCALPPVLPVAPFEDSVFIDSFNFRCLVKFLILKGGKLGRVGLDPGNAYAVPENLTYYPNCLNCLTISLALLAKFLNEGLIYVDQL